MASARVKGAGRPAASAAAAMPPSWRAPMP